VLPVLVGEERKTKTQNLKQKYFVYYDVSPNSTQKFIMTN